MATLTLRLTKGSPLTNLEIDTNFSNINNEVATKLNIPAANGFAVRNAATTSINRSIAVSGSGLSITNADGVSGNPTIASNATSLNTASTIVLRDASGNFTAGTVTLTALNTGTVALGTSAVLTFEGSTSDANKTTLTVANPTASRTITLPDVTGTVVTTGDTGTVTNAMLAGSIVNSKLVNNTITINGTSISLGGSITLTSADTSWTGIQTFFDNKFQIKDDVDNTKILQLQVSNITTGTTRTLTVPDESGTIATQAYTQTYVQRAGYNSQGSKTLSTAAPSVTTGYTDGDIWYQY